MNEDKNPLCIKTSCIYWQLVREASPATANFLCQRCGFSKEEDKLRKKIPLTMCDDGLRRKLIPPRKAGESNG